MSNEGLGSDRSSFLKFELSFEPGMNKEMSVMRLFTSDGWMDVLQRNKG